MPCQRSYQSKLIAIGLPQSKSLKAMQTLISQPQNFKDKRVPVKKAITILAKNNISVNEEEAKVILDLLYLIAKSTRAIEVESVY